MTEQELDELLIPAILQQAEEEQFDLQEQPKEYVVVERRIDADNVKRELVEVTENV